MGIYQPAWKIPVANSQQIDAMLSLKKRHTFNIDPIVYENQQNLRLKFQKNTLGGFTVRLSYDPTPVDVHVGVIYAAIILFIFYILLIYEVKITCLLFSKNQNKTEPFTYHKNLLFFSHLFLVSC